jgi:hypothetical protein
LLLIAGLIVGGFIVSSYYYVASQDGTVSVMRGVQGRFLGVPLQKPYRAACLDASGEVQVTSFDKPSPGCKLLRVEDLDQSGRAQVNAGLKGGNYDEAFKSLRELVRGTLRPCQGQASSPPATPPTTTTTTTAPPSTPAPPPTLAPSVPAESQTEKPGPSVSANAPPPPSTPPPPHCR